ncbi:MAG: YraN family protein [Oscillospiraceae bacterium]|nr:YraN family protein [Oscillospiraceae bacterium]
MSNSKRGRLGEEFVVRHLEKNGFETVALNYHSKFGEIDIIAENDEYIVFVEVKTRRSGSMVRPAEAVNSSKIRKILGTVKSFLLERPDARSLQPRFDVAEVVFEKGLYTLNYIEAAFDAELGEMGDFGEF